MRVLCLPPQAGDMEAINALSQLSGQLADAVANGGRSLAAVHGRPHVPSTGVVWRTGVIVTTDHTLQRSEDITVTLADGQTAPAVIVGRDPATDLAVLRVEAATEAAVIAPPDSARAGSLVLALGRPDDAEAGPTASFGILSSVSGAWRTWRGGQVDRFLRPDTTVYTGFSGGSLADTEGRVIGINTTGLTRGGAITLPASTVERVVEELLTRGHVRGAYLGVGLHPVRVSEQQTGLIILSLEPEGPAAKAGLLLGDVLLKVNGGAVVDTEDVQSQLAAENIGQSLPVEILRGGRAMEIPVVPGERRHR